MYQSINSSWVCNRRFPLISIWLQPNTWVKWWFFNRKPMIWWWYFSLKGPNQLYRPTRVGCYCVIFFTIAVQGWSDSITKKWIILEYSFTNYNTKNDTLLTVQENESEFFGYLGTYIYVKYGYYCVFFYQCSPRMIGLKNKLVLEYVLFNKSY